MRTVFADSNYWIGLLNPKDNQHARAIAASNALGRVRLITSEMVLVEVLNGLARFPALRHQAVTLTDRIMTDPNTDVVPLSGMLFRDALAEYKRHLDKQWSIVDCASFVIMRQRGLHEALTHDHHFTQAGFTALLRDPE